MSVHFKNLMLAVLFILSSSLPYVYSQEVPESSEKPIITVVGQFVLPENSPQSLDTNKLSAKIIWVPPDILPKPAGFENITKEEQRNWLKEFVKSDEFKKLTPQLVAFGLKSRQLTKKITVSENGTFEVDGLMQGKWLIMADIPHGKNTTHSHAYVEHRFELKHGENKVDLGHIILNVNKPPLLETGDLAPEFTAQDYKGGQFKLSDFRGKYVIIDFWATWCFPCLGEIPNLEAVYKEFAGERFEIIGLSVDKTFDDAKSFLDKKPSPYKHGYLGDRDNAQAYKDYGIDLIPAIWLIGPDGKVVARDLRGDAVRKAVAKAITGTE